MTQDGMRVYWATRRNIPFFQRWVRAEAMPVASVVALGCAMSVGFGIYIANKNPQWHSSKSSRTRESVISYSAFKFPDSEEPFFKK